MANATCGSGIDQMLYFLINLLHDHLGKTSLLHHSHVQLTAPASPTAQEEVSTAQGVASDRARELERAGHDFAAATMQLEVSLCSELHFKDCVVVSRHARLSHVPRNGNV